MEQENLIESIEGSPRKKERPIVLSVICLFNFIGAVFTIPVLFSEDAKIMGNWYPPYLAFATIIGLTCMIGLWKMKKWAAYSYTGFVAINQIVMLTMGKWNAYGLLLPLFVVVIALTNLKNME
jgi:hypothetical protein